MNRFKVTSISGWNIGPTGAQGKSKPPPAEWYVLDSADCYRIVSRFYIWGNQHRRRNDPEAEARAYAAQLEQAYP